MLAEPWHFLGIGPSLSGWSNFRASCPSSGAPADFSGIVCVMALDSSKSPSLLFRICGSEQLSSPHWLFGLGKQVSISFRAKRVQSPIEPARILFRVSVINLKVKIKVTSHFAFFPWVLSTLIPREIFYEQIKAIACHWKQRVLGFQEKFTRFRVGVPLVLVPSTRSRSAGWSSVVSFEILPPTPSKCRCKKCSIL